MSEPTPTPDKSRRLLRVKAIETKGDTLRIDVDEKEGGRFTEAFGTTSHDFADTRLMQIVNRTSGSDDERAKQLNAALAIIEAVAPQNEVEGALAAQMADVDAMIAKIMRRAATDNRVEVCDRYITQATKLQRTFISQVEALAKLRGGHTQRVEVIYVDNRGGQAVVTQGGGALERKGRQPHEPCLASLALAPGVPVRGQDEGRDSMSIASDPRPEALPIPRRQEPRRTKRGGERQLSTRAPHGGSAGLSPPGDGDDAPGSRNAA